MPIEEYSYNSTMLEPLEACVRGPCPDESMLKFYTISVTPIIYVMALVAFVGWFLFVVFGGAFVPRAVCREPCAAGRVPLAVCCEPWGSTG